MKFGQLIEYEVAKYYFPRIMKKMRQGDQFQKLYIRQRQVFSNLVLIHFGRSLLEHAIKTNRISEC